MDSDSAKIMGRLKEDGRFSYLFQTTTFEGSRRDENGDIQGVTITVHDHGPDSGSTRYSVIVKADDGRVTSSHHHKEIDSAIGALNWDHLDKAASGAH